MTCRVWAIALAATALSAADPVWDWLPRAADADRPCEIHLTAPEGWRATPGPGLQAGRDGGQIVLVFQPATVSRVAVEGPEQRALTIRCLAPGTAANLSADADGRLRAGDDAAILAVPRREAAADRRWGILRAMGGDRIEPCRTTVDEPSLSNGLPALTRQIAASQAIKPAGGVLVLLSGDDRFAAWKHREYRQALAWLVIDLGLRGATHVVLVEPTCPTVDEALLAPLREQVRDVARAYRCSVVDTTALGDHALWEESPGVLGQRFNVAGKAQRDRLLLPWLASGG